MPTLFENITGVSISIQINADQKNIAHANVLAGAVWHVDLEEGKEVTIQVTPPSPAKQILSKVVYRGRGASLLK